MPRIIPEYKEEVRKKIIGIAYQIFLTRGYRGTTMEDIAGALGVTKPAQRPTFGSGGQMMAKKLKNAGDNAGDKNLKGPRVSSGPLFTW